jgi:Holliday junction DNA helicase RuvA
MYNHFKGIFVEKHPSHTVVECAGVGYLLQTSLNTYTQIKDLEEGVLLAVQIVREDEISLFGFYDADERELFKLLITVSGVGPNTAKMALSSLSTKEIHQAIVQEDLDTIKRIKGIGAKTAQKIIIDLKDKVTKLNPQAGGSLMNNPQDAIAQDALQALMALQINKAIAERAIQKVLSVHKEVQVEDLIRLVLRNLS